VEYSRARPGERALSDINEVLRRTLILFQNYPLYRRLRIVTDLAPGLPRVELDRVAWEQVMLELFTNAQEAMANAGCITIATRQIEAPACEPVNSQSHEAAETAAIPRSWVEVAVQDDGPGIAATDLPRVFDPFFTTKGGGEGMGLGLKIARDIVLGHGGRLRVESDGNRGTRVVIHLPVATGSRPPHSRLVARPAIEAEMS
jgi:signal transduction histidine kinase